MERKHPPSAENQPQKEPYLPQLDLTLTTDKCREVNRRIMEKWEADKKATSQKDHDTHMYWLTNLPTLTRRDLPLDCMRIVWWEGNTLHYPTTWRVFSPYADKSYLAFYDFIPHTPTAKDPSTQQLALMMTYTTQMTKNALNELIEIPITVTREFRQKYIK